MLAVGDGGLGLWAALNEVYPETRHQRCWNHRILNVLDKLPRRLHAEARKAIHDMYESPDRQACARLRVTYCAQMCAQGQTDAAECLKRDWDDFTTFYNFHQEHWIHLRTSNPIESVFAGVRLCTDAAKRMRVRKYVLYLVFKLGVRLSRDWYACKAVNQLGPLWAGHRFVDGRLQLPHPSLEKTAA